MIVKLAHCCDFSGDFKREIPRVYTGDLKSPRIAEKIFNVNGPLRFLQNSKHVKLYNNPLQTLTYTLYDMKNEMTTLFVLVRVATKSRKPLGFGSADETKDMSSRFVFFCTIKKKLPYIFAHLVHFPQKCVCHI